MNSGHQLQNEKNATVTLLPRSSRRGEESRRWIRAHPLIIFPLIAFAFLLNYVFAMKYNFPWSSPALSSPSYTSLNSLYNPHDAQKLLGADNPSGTWPVQSYKTESFLAPDMVVNKTGATSGGYLFINPKGNGTSATGPAIMTEDNELVWHGGLGDSTNLRVQSLHGNPVITYWNGTSTATFGHAYGSISILDKSYTKIAEVCMKDLDLKIPDDAEYPCHLDMHESYLTDHGTVLATAYNVTRFDLSSAGGPKDGWIFDSFFFEIDIFTEEVLFSWRSLDHLHEVPLTDSNLPFKSKGNKVGHSQHAPWDYFHINSVQPIDRGYLVNSRHTFAMYKINHKGNVEWQLQGIHGGDFELDAGIRFSWQHMPRIISSSPSNIHLTLYNNDNSQVINGKDETTGLDLSLDLVSKKVSLNRKLTDPTDTIFSASQGSYQSLPDGHVLLGHGQVAKVKEYDADGAVVYTAQFGASTPQLLVASYRAYRYEWHVSSQCVPHYVPKVVAEIEASHSHPRTHVYMSWNGASHINQWAVYAGNATDHLPHAVTVPKTGFETKVSLVGAVKYVRTDAVQVDGDMRYAWSTPVQRVRSVE